MRNVNEPTSGANDALAGIRQRAQRPAYYEAINEDGNDIWLPGADDDIATLLAALDATEADKNALGWRYAEVNAALTAANEHVAALERENANLRKTYAAHAETHHYTDEYVDALHHELAPKVPDDTAPTREPPSPLGDTRIADEVAAEYLEAHAGEDLLADLHEAMGKADLFHTCEHPGCNKLMTKGLRFCYEHTPPAPGALGAATKLNARQLLALTILAESGQGVAIWRTTSKKYKTIHKETAKFLIEHGYAVSTRNGRRIQITDAGRAALADATPNGGTGNNHDRN